MNRTIRTRTVGGPTARPVGRPVRLALAGVAAAALVIAGCGGDGDSESATTTTVEAATTTTGSEAPATAEDESAAIRGWASDLAPVFAAFQESSEAISTGCRMVPEDCSTAEVIGRITVGLNAERIQLELELTEEARGAPPGEIEDLVATTADAADAVKSSYDAADAEQCPNDGASPCREHLVEFARAVSDMDDELVRWSPYL
jgi:hypothetical protein